MRGSQQHMSLTWEAFEDPEGPIGGGGRSRE